MADINTPLDASKQSDVNGALQQMLLNRVKTKDQMDQMGENRQGALANYQQALNTSPYNEYSPTRHAAFTQIANMGKMSPWGALTSGIGAGGLAKEEFDKQRYLGNVNAHKVGYEDAKDLDKLDVQELSALMKLAKSTASGAKATVKMDKDGNMVVYDPSNPTEARIVHSSQRGEYQRVWQKAYDRAVAEGMPNPEDYAHHTSANVLGQSAPGTTTAGAKQSPYNGAGNAGVAGSDGGTGVVQGAGNTNTPPANAKGSFVLPEDKEKGLYAIDLKGSREELLKQLNEVKDPVERERMIKSFNAATFTPDGQVQEPAKTGATTIQYKDKRQEEQRKAIGSEEGKLLVKEYEGFKDVGAKSAGLVNTLNQMEAIITKNPSMPEGELGPHIQTFRSALKSLGVEVDPATPDSQVFDALAKKLALGMKNADGQNLMPGAMSNYEDQLLQSMAPGLRGTREGNLKLMQFMREMAQTNLRFAKEANDYATNSSSNKGALDANWEARKQRLVKEEMVRLKRRAAQIMGVE